MKNTICRSAAVAALLLVAPASPLRAEINALPPQAQHSYRISGKVTDSAGEGLTGATVMVKGTTIGTSADIDGNFELKLPKNGKVTLIVTYVGMKTRELQASPGENLDIQLEDNTDTLEEVIVSGFQTISRERNTGSAVVVNTEKLGKVQAPDLTSKLEGLAPGLTIYNNEMSIRGTSSFSLSSTPLLVIDGQPATGMSLGDINPETIESVTVLKDAAATSLYGVYASNGVIVVTTKNGGEGKVEANFSLSYYLSPAPSLDYQHYASTSDIIDLEQQMLTNHPDYLKSPSAYFGNKNNKTNAAYLSGLDMLYYRMSRNEIDESQLNSALDAMRRNDYRREYRDRMLRSSLTQDYNLALKAGSEKYGFYAAVRYQKPGYYLRGNSEDRLSFYTNNNLRLAPWMRLTLGANIMYKKMSSSQAEGLGATAAMPYDTLFEPDGSPSYRYLYNEVLAQDLENREGVFSMRYNAWEEAANNKYKSDDLYMKYFLQAEFDIMPGLNLQIKGQYEKRKLSSNQYDEADSYKMRSMINEFASTDSRGSLVYNIPKGGHILYQDNSYDNYNLRAQFNYNATFADRHSVTALLGGEIRQDKSDAHSSERYGYDDMRLTYSQVDWLTLSQTGVVGQLYSSLRKKSENLYVADVKHRYVSAYFNAGYVYDGKYSVNGSVRVEQADLFGSDPKYRYRPLWSAGAAWNMEQEEFLHNATWIDRLKLRATYGITGMVDQSSSPYLLAVFGTSLYTNAPMTSIVTPPNSSLRWEKTSTFNAGADFSFFNKLTGNIDFYYKYSSDLLVSKSIDPSLGFGESARANNGAMKNIGTEITLAYRWIDNRDFSLSTSLTAAYNSNKVDKVDYDPSDALDMIRYPKSNYRAGDTYNSLYAYRYAGLTDTGNPSVYDQNGEIVSINPVRNIGALVCVGQLAPKWNGAFNVDFRWKELSLFAKAVCYAGHSLRLDVPTLYDSSHKLTDGAVLEGIADRWTPDNTSATVPVMGTYGDSGERNEHWKYADANTESATFIKLRNIGVSYTFPQRILKKTRVFKNAQLRFQIDNLCHWASNSRGIDPEAYNANGGARYDQQTPTYVFGLNFSF